MVQPPAVAQSIWNGGGGNGSWSDPGNWSTLPATSSSTSLLLFGGNTQTAVFNDWVIRTGSIRFTNNGTSGSTAAFTLSGSSLILTATSNSRVTLETTGVSSGTITDIISLDLDLQAGNPHFFTINSGHNVTIDGKITGNVINKRQVGTLTLTNTASTFVGVTPAEGVIRTPMIGMAGFASPIGSGTVMLVGATSRSGTVSYYGATGETTDKFFGVAGNGSGGLEHDGGGPLVFTSGTFVSNNSGPSSRFFVLSGTNRSDNDIQGIIADVAASGTLSLRKSGPGFWKLSGANTYTGSTAILGGRLIVAPTGSLANTSSITIDGSDAELRWNSATTMDRPLTFTQGTISGTGTIGVALTVGANQVLSPGNSPGNQGFSAGLTLAPDGTEVWEIDDATGAKGVNWDLITVSGGALDLTSLSSGSPFNLNLVTLSGTAAGAMANYTAGNAYRWRIFDATSLTLPSSFDGDLVTTGTYVDFTDVTSLFTLGTNGWQNGSLDLADVKVEVADDGTGLDLVIVGVVPEPSTLALAAAGIGVAAWRCRRRRSGIAT